MSTLNVPRLEFAVQYPDITLISDMLDTMVPFHKIDLINWKEFNYSPFVSFSVACSSKEIFLKYRVKENYLLAVNTETNQKVWEDSCVEFFFSPDESGKYYNFEFNAIGTCLVGYGEQRHNRRLMDKSVVESIRRRPTLGKEPIPVEQTGELFWDLTIAIPFGLFGKREQFPVVGRRYRANFYKCGDKLSVPHFLTWSPVNTEKPDFHAPEFFGDLVFCG